jgi:hypothetical protein
VTRHGQAGSSPLGSILGLLLGGGAALVVAALFMTGLAQRQIMPWARARAEQAVERATTAVKPGSQPPAGGAAGAGAGDLAGRAVDSTATAGAGRDSAQSLAVQIETQKSFLAQREAELKRMRAGIDSLQQKSVAVDATELKRQAKLFAAMKAEEAALVLGAMDDATLALLLDAMNAKAAAKVMARLDAARVARLASRAVHKGEVTSAVTLAGQEAGPAAR